MQWFKLILCTLCIVCMTHAQIPLLGWCPEYVPMADFNMNRFLGRWYESERYFSVAEVGTRCVLTNYVKGPNGKIYVSNKITNRLTGVKREVDGVLQEIGKTGEGRLNVRYTNLPVSYDTSYTVLGTDYDTYAVLWSCNGIGPVHTQNAWVMTRERLPAGTVLQKAYGILDKFKISRTFFIKTDQESCSKEHDELNSVTEASEEIPEQEDEVYEEENQRAVEKKKPVKMELNEEDTKIKDEVAQKKIVVAEEQGEEQKSKPVSVPERIMMTEST